MRHTIKGASHLGNEQNLEVTVRPGDFANHRSFNVGFRVFRPVRNTTVTP